MPLPAPSGTRYRFDASAERPSRGRSPEAGMGRRGHDPRPDDPPGRGWRERTRWSC